jgi:hypothetical protein
MTHLSLLTCRVQSCLHLTEVVEQCVRRRAVQKAQEQSQLRIQRGAFVKRKREAVAPLARRLRLAAVSPLKIPWQELHVRHQPRPQQHPPDHPILAPQ